MTDVDTGGRMVTLIQSERAPQGGSSRLRARLVGPDATVWQSILADAQHDFYHLPGYVVASALHDGGEPRALIVEDGGRRLLLPLVVRLIAGGGRDACSPYGYPGPIQTGEYDADFERDALQAGVELLRASGFVSLFIRTHPLLNPLPPECIGEVVRHGNTVAVDLTLSEEELWKQTRRNHRQQIRQALAEGYVAELDVDGCRFDQFKALYRATMEDRAADDYYYFEDAYFDELRQALGDSLHLAIASRDGTVAAVGLFVVTGDIAQMHLTGHDARFAKDQPMKLVFHHVRTWAREQGLRVLHLGGGRGGADDSLLHFKAGFSPLCQPYHTIRVVIAEDEYARLVSVHAPDVDAADLTLSFPAYRRCLPRS